MGTNDVNLGHYSAALDELYALRAVLAAEAMRIEADLSYKTFPKSRRPFAEEAAERFRAAARGDLWPAYRALKRPNIYLRECGAKETLTRAAFESSASHDPGCLRCQQDRHVCPGCGSSADHSGVVRDHDPTCVSLETTRP